MSVETRMSAIYLLLAVVVFVGGGVAVMFGVKTHTVSHTRVVRVARSWGKPDSTVDGAQVNPQLKGLTCDVYSKKQTIVCHP